MQLPSPEAAVQWAKDQAVLVADHPSTIRRNLLVLLHIIKKQEEELARSADTIRQLMAGQIRRHK